MLQGLTRLCLNYKVPYGTFLGYGLSERQKEVPIETLVGGPLAAVPVERQGYLQKRRLLLWMLRLALITVVKQGLMKSVRTEKL
jgi:hypothetical protein